MILKIKKLKWHKRSLSDNSGSFLCSFPMPPLNLNYAVDIDFPEDGQYKATTYPCDCFDERSLGKFNSLEKAKQKCQAHFEKIIKSAFVE